MKRLFLLLAIIVAIAVFLVQIASAAISPATANLSWTQPSSRTDGTPLEPTDLAGYRIYSAVDGAVSEDPDSEYIAVTRETTRVVTFQLAPRKEPYVLSFGVRAVDTKGRVSGLSNIATKTVKKESTADPMPPTEVRVEFDCTGPCLITVID